MRWFVPCAATILVLTGCGGSSTPATPDPPVVTPPPHVIPPPVIVPPVVIPPVVIPPVVTPPAPTTGVMTVAWADPTMNTDGSALTNLAGVRIYLDSSTVVSLGLGQLLYEFTDIPLGNHCVAMVAFNSLGAESVLTATVCKSVVS